MAANHRAFQDFLKMTKIRTKKSVSQVSWEVKRKLLRGPLDICKATHKKPTTAAPAKASASSKQGIEAVYLAELLARRGKGDGRSKEEVGVILDVPASTVPQFYSIFLSCNGIRLDPLLREAHELYLRALFEAYAALMGRERLTLQLHNDQAAFIAHLYDHAHEIFPCTTEGQDYLSFPQGQEVHSLFPSTTHRSWLASGNVFVCPNTGLVHICEAWLCRGNSIEPVSGQVSCLISGYCWGNAMVNQLQHQGRDSVRRMLMCQEDDEAGGTYDLAEETEVSSGSGTSDFTSTIRVYYQEILEGPCAGHKGTSSLQQFMSRMGVVFAHNTLARSDSSSSSSSEMGRSQSTQLCLNLRKHGYDHNHSLVATILRHAEVFAEEPAAAATGSSPPRFVGSLAPGSVVKLKRLQAGSHRRNGAPCPYPPKCLTTITLGATVEDFGRFWRFAATNFLHERTLAPEKFAGCISERFKRMFSLGISKLLDLHPQGFANLLDALLAVRDRDPLLPLVGVLAWEMSTEAWCKLHASMLGSLVERFEVHLSCLLRGSTHPFTRSSSQFVMRTLFPIVLQSVCKIRIEPLKLGEIYVLRTLISFSDIILPQSVNRTSVSTKKWLNSKDILGILPSSLDAFQTIHEHLD